MHLRTFLATLCFMVMFATLAVAGITFPTLTGRVVDDAHVLQSDTITTLTEELANHERATTNQIVVVTLPSLNGYDIADYGYQLGRHWAIGQKGKNNGVLLIVAPNERKVRIEVGYGLEGDLTDAQCSEIIQGIILPEFRKKSIEGGVIAGTHAILSVLGGTGMPAHADVKNNEISPVVFAILLFLFCYICIRNPALAYILVSSAGRSRGGWSGGGGFSGGGGSFGGGGSSGSW